MYIDYLINLLLINEQNKISYSIISFFGPLLGIFVNRAIEATANARKKEVNIFPMLINCIALCIISIFIQVKSLYGYHIILFFLYNYFILSFSWKDFNSCKINS